MLKRTLSSLVLSLSLFSGCGDAPQDPWRFEDAAAADAQRIPRWHADNTPPPACETGCIIPGYRDSPCADDLDCLFNEYCELTSPELPWFGYCIDREKLGCEFHYECNPDRSEACIDAYCTEVYIEECNAVDDDRDGEVDEGLLGMPCYSGPEETRNVGTCRDGLELCRDGVWRGCSGDSLPVAEEGILSCDGLDNNCDGCADDLRSIDGVCLPSKVTLFDIVLVMDTSTSMEEELEGSRAAASQIGVPFAGNPSYQFALVQIPYGTPRDPESSVVHTFSEFGPFYAALSRIGFSSGAEEPSYDIISLLAREEISRVRFRDGSRRIFIMFTDERGQSYQSPRIRQEDMCGSLRPGDVFGAIVASDYEEEFSLCADPLFYLAAAPETISDYFNAILATSCGRTGGP